MNTPAPVRKRRNTKRGARASASPRGDRATSVRTPTLVVVGEARHREKIAASLAPVRLGVETFDTVEDALGAFALSVVGIVLAPATDDATPAIADRVRTLRTDSRTSKLPIFLIVSDDAEPRVARRLYAEGATAVLAWPREALLLPRIVTELLAVAPRPRSLRPVDRALARAARARMKLVEGVGSDLRVGASDGVLHVRGSVPSLRVKEMLEAFASHIPGVRSIVSAGLRVRPSGASDRTIARRVRELLGDIVEGDTLSVSVDDGHVVLMGSVEDRAAFEQVVGLLSSVSGVRAITNLTEQSSTSRRRDHRVAAHLQRAIEQSHPAARVRVSVLGGVAVLTGEVDLVATRSAIRRRAQSESEISRVVDKIEVRDA